MIGLPDFLPTTIMHLSLTLRVSGDAPKNCRLETYWFSDHDSDYTVDGGVVRYVGEVVWLIFFSNVRPVFRVRRLLCEANFENMIRRQLAEV